jgi:hypothetical protein
MIVQYSNIQIAPAYEAYTLQRLSLQFLFSRFKTPTALNTKLLRQCSYSLLKKLLQ